jgi:hypothetical protein
MRGSRGLGILLMEGRGLVGAGEPFAGFRALSVYDVNVAYRYTKSRTNFKSFGGQRRMAKAHEAKDGWSPLTNDPTWPSRDADATGSRLPREPSTSATGEITAYIGAGLCPKVPNAKR